jgi:hypothetical protein
VANPAYRGTPIFGESNPYITNVAPTRVPPLTALTASLDGVVSTGPATPPGGVPALPKERRLPRLPASGSPALYWVGAHGGAGASTLTRLIDGTATVGRGWPLLPHGTVPCVIVARTHHAGLQAAQDAVTDWASGALRSVELVGLAFIADAPGRLPKTLRNRLDVVRYGAPRFWPLPWVESWRQGVEPHLDDAPRTVRDFAAELTALVPALRGGHYPTPGSAL